MLATLLPPVHGRLSGEQVGHQYCPPGDYCPFISIPPKLTIPAGIWVWLNWTSLNGTSVNVLLADDGSSSLVPSCYWGGATSGLCEFHAPNSPDPVAYELDVGAAAWQNGSLPVIAYTFTW